MSKFQYSEIGDEVLADVLEQFKPAVGDKKHDREAMLGNLVSKKVHSSLS